MFHIRCNIHIKCMWAKTFYITTHCFFFWSSWKHAFLREPDITDISNFSIKIPMDTKTTAHTYCICNIHLSISCTRRERGGGKKWLEGSGIKEAGKSFDVSCEICESQRFLNWSIIVFRLNKITAPGLYTHTTFE